MCGIYVVSICRPLHGSRTACRSQRQANFHTDRIQSNCFKYKALTHCWACKPALQWASN